jgi:hypothetical protein
MTKAYRDASFLKIVTLLMTIFIIWISPAWAVQDGNVATVHAVGGSHIRGADMSASRNAAISQSLISAVIEVLTDMVPPETVEGHFQVISENILSQTDQFIRDYKMLTESTHGKQHRVLVRATVSVQRMEKVLKQSGIYIGEKIYPKVLYCIAEKQVNDLNFDYWWGGRHMGRTGTASAAISRVSEKKGLVVIRPETTLSMVADTYQLSVPEAVSLGGEMQADVVVIGEAIAEDAANTIDSTLQSYRGSVFLRAYRVLNSKEIGQSRQVAIASAADPLSGGTGALEKASLLAGEDLSAQIVDTWFTEGAGASKIELFVEGISGNIANFVKLRGALSSMSGVDSVQRKEMQSDTAVLLVDYQGNVRALSDALMRQSFDTFSLRIAAPEANTLRLQLVQR